MQSCEEVVTAYFQSLITRCDSSGRPTGLPKHDQTIYYVVATRCEIDMNGFDSVFDQLLDQNEVQSLIAALHELRESQLAALFESAHSRLNDVGFFGDGPARVSDYDTEDETGILDEIEARLSKNDALWNLDDKLVKLIPEATV